MNGLLPKSKPTHNSHNLRFPRIIISVSYRVLQTVKIYEKHKWPVWATAREDVSLFFTQLKLFDS